MTIEEIHAEITRLKTLRNERQAAADADAAQHRSRWDEPLQARLRAEAEAIDGKIRALEARRLAVEMGEKDLAERPTSVAAVDREARAMVEDVVATLVAVVKDLRARLEAVEQRGIEHVGTWQRAAGYRRNQVVTCDGTSWVATRETLPHEKPGDCDAWQLALKVDPPKPPKARKTVKKITNVLAHDEAGRISRFETIEEQPG